MAMFLDMYALLFVTKSKDDMLKLMGLLSKIFYLSIVKPAFPKIFNTYEASQ